MLRRCPAPTILLLVLLLLSSKTANLVASPLPPNVLASRSTNGRFLVITEQEFDNPDPRVVRRVVRTTYRVLEAEDFINSKDRLNTPAAFWSALSWQVTLEESRPPYVRWPLISNDGQSLVLVGITCAVPGITVLETYRKNGFRQGSLVRSFQITDLWTAGELDPSGKGIFGCHDATPEWFAGGSLAFSQNDRNLIYRTQWNDQLKISLVDGVVSRERLDH